MQRVRVRLPARPVDYEIRIGAAALNLLGKVARRNLSTEARRLVVVTNRKVSDLYGQQSVDALRSSGFQVEVHLIGDGERYKSLRQLERALSAFAAAGLERSDGVVALGGGVVGDLAGLAAALYLRGLAFLQVPTTLLAQVDSSVGGKVAVNTEAGKNLIGAFQHPRAVLVDTNTLRTLPARELVAGWCESIKQGAAGCSELFYETYSFLRDLAGERTTLAGRRLERLIAAQVSFKARIVAGDEREDVGRTDASSRRILNFGHTTAHALEAATGFRRFRHGEAVGYGMLVAGEISRRLGLLGRSELELLRDAVRHCGRLPRAGELDEAEILRRLAQDKKSVGGRIQWVLLEGIGRARIVDGRKISQPLLRASLRAGLQGVSANRE